MRPFVHIFLCISVLFGAQMQNNAHAQSLMRHSLTNQDFKPYQLPIKDKNEKHDPKRATVMSAIVPGLGQVYNDKYWKVGVIYVAGFAMAYGMKYNLDSMRRYQKALSARIDTSSATTDLWYPFLTDAKVKGERDYYRKNRDMLILGFVGLYAIQIIDANVDAHLKEFEINPDLSMKITPDIRMYSLNQFGSGLSVQLRF